MDVFVNVAWLRRITKNKMTSRTTSAISVLFGLLASNALAANCPVTEQEYFSIANPHCATLSDARCDVYARQSIGSAQCSSSKSPAPNAAKGSPSYSPKSPTLTGLTSQDAAKEVQGNALQDSQKELTELEHSSDSTSKSIKKFLSQAKQRELKLLEGSEAQRAIARHDDTQVRLAEKAVKENRGFSFDEVNKVKDLGIRKNLFVVAGLQDMKAQFQEEKVRVNKQISELKGMAARSEGNSTGMNSISSPTSAKATNPSSAQAENQTMEPENSSAISESKSEANLGGEDKGSAFSDRDLSLRDRLIRELEAEEKSKGGSQITSLGANDKTAASKLTKDLLDSPATQKAGESTGTKFSLSNSETDAEVKRMIGTLDGSTADQANLDSKAGILETESPTLFARVKSQLSDCLHSRCVNSAYLAK